MNPYEALQPGYMTEQIAYSQHYTAAHNCPPMPMQEWPCSDPYSDLREYPHLNFPGTLLTPRVPIRWSTYSSLMPPLTGNDNVKESCQKYAVPADATHTMDDCKSLPAQQANSLDANPKASQLISPAPPELVPDRNITESSGSPDCAFDAGRLSPRCISSAYHARKDDNVERPKVLKQRKVYFKAVSDNVGFTITDPDTITLHDKKRNYLECLEEYVLWLHEQIRLVSQEPVPLERISTYRGLKYRSLRTILVHQQDVIRELNVRRMHSEEEYMQLQDAFLMQQQAQSPF